MARHAGPPACETESEQHTQPPLTTGRLIVWLIFWLFLAVLVLSTVVGLTGGAAQ